MTALLSVVFSKMFNTEITQLAPYILSGMIIWEFVIASAVGGSLAFIQADAYIKQCTHPLAIYTLRTVFTNIMVLSMASLSLVAWVLIVMPQNFGWSWLAALAIFPVLFFIAWPMATILAYIATRFRDLPHALTLILQAMWFVSPIYFEAKLFRDGGIAWLIEYNPIYHMLEIVRAPLLHGLWPTFENFAFSFVTIIILTALAILVGRNAEKKIIFYL